jgi:acetate kinase
MKQVLLIDKDKDFASRMRQLFESKGYRCVSMPSVTHPFQLPEHRPDIIVIDVALDNATDGFKIVNKLRSPYNDVALADIPILVVTTVEQVTGLEFRKIAGTRLLPVDGYMRKPVDCNHVLNEVERILNRKVPLDSESPALQDMLILCLNCGSSSVKYKLYNWQRKETVASGLVERVGQPNSVCQHELPGHDRIVIQQTCSTHSDAIKLVLANLTHEEYGVIKHLKDISAVGHRVVHGGEKFAKSIIINDEALDTFKQLTNLAPLHNPPNIMGIETARALIPGIPHVAVMDTAWHQTIPAYVYTYALPYEWYELHKVRRYGFHGTSLLYVSRRCAVLLGKDPFKCNLIICHIGNGVSLNAVKHGVSFDTSMGFTPLEGLVMGTRAGDHDAAVDLFMMQKEGYTPEQMNSILNKKSGIIGITGKYIDRRDLLAARSEGNAQAQLALDIEIYRLKKYIGAYAAALGRIDAIAFTAGVGEMCDYIRGRVLDGLGYMGVRYSATKNEIARTHNAECDISDTDSDVKVFVIPTDEERVFIEDVVAVVEKNRTGRISHTYRFQSPQYTNELRKRMFIEESRENPQLYDVVAKIPQGG